MENRKWAEENLLIRKRESRMSEHHHHAHGTPTPEEAKALLAYMTDHNKHHVEELLELSQALPETVRAMVHEAAKALRQGTDQLQKALEQLEDQNNVSV